MKNKKNKRKNMETKIALFKGNQIRRTIHNNEWWFSIVDIIEILTDSINPRDYWYCLKKREKESSGLELSTICRQLKLESSDSKKYKTEVELKIRRRRRFDLRTVY